MARWSPWTNGPQSKTVACPVLLHEQHRHPQGTRFYLTKSPTLLGRVEGADIVLPYDTLSRRQCRFHLRDGAWWVVDDMSTGDAYVNFEHVHQHGSPTATCSPSVGSS